VRAEIVYAHPASLYVPVDTGLNYVKLLAALFNPKNRRWRKTLVLGVLVFELQRNFR
jgi:hypothetical protein